VTNLSATRRIQAEPAVEGVKVKFGGRSQQVLVLQRAGMLHALFRFLLKTLQGFVTVLVADCQQQED